MLSVIHHSKDTPGYVMAIHADSAEAEQWIASEGGGEESGQTEFVGAVRVGVEDLVTGFHSRRLGAGISSAERIHGGEGKDG